MIHGDNDDLDTTILESVARDAGIEAMPDLIDAFARDCIRREQRLSTAQAARDFESIEHEAHALVSSARTFGAIGLANVAQNVESACQEHRHDDAIAGAKDLLRRASVARQALQEQRDHYIAALGGEM